MISEHRRQQMREAHRRYHKKNREKRLADQRERRKTPAGKLITRQSNWRRYGIKITKEQYKQMVQAQNSVCAICLSRGTRDLDVDHCHSTGEIRGLLCQDCNLGIGKFKDRTDLLDRASAYLKSQAKEPAA